MAELPDWQPLDRALPTLDGTGAGRIVAVVASEGAVGAGWAAPAALDLARSWSGAGNKVIIVDAGVHHPTLHAHAEVDNGEGLSDASLFGVSVGRVARPVNGGAYFLITAGTAVADANSVARSPRWGRLLEGFIEAGVTLLVFVQDGDSGCAAFLGAASQIVVLSSPGEAPPAAIRDLEGLVQAVAGPGESSMVDAVALRPPEEWTSGAPGGRTRLILLALAVVLLVVFLVAAFGLLDLSGFAPAADSVTSRAAPPLGVPGTG